MQAEFEDNSRAGLAEDGVGLPCPFSICDANGHLGGGMRFIIAAVDRVMLDICVFEDIVVARDVGRIEIANHGRSVRLLGAERRRNANERDEADDDGAECPRMHI